MLTPSLTARVAAILSGVLALGGCTPRVDRSSRAPAPGATRLAVRVDNSSSEWIDVYLIREPWEWHLGRVEPGARAALPVPARAAREGSQGMVWLAVIAGGHRTMQPSRDPGAVTGPKEPLAALVLQPWTFDRGQLR